MDATVTLSQENWQHLISLAERGASVVCQQLASEPGRMAQVAEVAAKASEIIGSVTEQLKE